MTGVEALAVLNDGLEPFLPRETVCTGTHHATPNAVDATAIRLHVLLQTSTSIIIPINFGHYEVGVRG